MCRHSGCSVTSVATLIFGSHSCLFPRSWWLQVLPGLPERNIWQKTPPASNQRLRRLNRSKQKSRAALFAVPRFSISGRFVPRDSSYSCSPPGVGAVSLVPSLPLFLCELFLLEGELALSAEDSSSVDLRTLLFLPEEGSVPSDVDVDSSPGPCIVSSPLWRGEAGDVLDRV